MKEAKPPGLVDDVGAGLEVEVVGVGQNRLGSQGPDHLRGEGLDVCLRAHGNEGGSADNAVRRVNDARAPKPTLDAQASADLEPAVGAVGSRRGRGWEGATCSGAGAPSQ